VSEILVEVGATVDVGTVLARIDLGAKPGEPHVEEQRAAPAVTPVVRRIAAEHNIDLTKVKGTGRLGRVTKKDVLAFMEQWGKEPRPEPVLHSESPYVEETPPAGVQESGPSPVSRGGDGVPLSPMRKSIAEHMVRSLQTAAHCTTVVEADMSAVEAARGSLSYLPFVARAAIAALREYPQLNATLEGDRLHVHEQVNLGIAVALGDDGLIVPVVHDAHELSHEGLARRIKDLADRARTKRLSPDDTKGGTFTITNPGRYGALLATPIINQPQVAILDLEAVVKRPVVVGDAIAIRPMTYLCMSWDHRALDGVLAARFLSSVRAHLEGWNG
jgi:2-oxoglutarate dehydrogenase E2 component (dihydrolipoamide succinyltransferase)